jgi:poly(U)-binding-splicing factor PUF60
VKTATAAASQALACRIYVGSLHFELTENDVKTAFAPFGPIKSISLSKDPLTGRSKGFCFIEYAYPEAAQAALQHMNGYLLGNRPIKVGRPHNAGGLLGLPLPLALNPLGPLAFSTPSVFPGTTAATTSSTLTSMPTTTTTTPSTAAEETTTTTLAASSSSSSAATAAQTTVEEINAMLKAQAAAAAASSQLDIAKRIYVGSIPWDLTADHLKTVFEAFGPIRSCVLMPNPETGRHKGYGFIEFEEVQAAEQAISQMNGWEIGGRQIKVGRAVASALPPSMMGTSAAGTSPLAAGLAGLGALGGVATNPAAIAAAAAAASLLGGAAGAVPTAGVVAANINTTLAQALAQRKAEDSLSHEENITISNPNQRYEIMQKLARGTAIKATRCVVLRNMVGPEDLDEDLAEEVGEECSKYGTVEKVYIHQETKSAKETEIIVKIFVLFSTIPEAQKAQQGLNGRYFAGRIVKADFFDDKKFLTGNYAD